MKIATSRNQFPKLIRDYVRILGLRMCGSILSCATVRRGMLHCDITDVTGQPVFIWAHGLKVFMLKTHRKGISSTFFLKVMA